MFMEIAHVVSKRSTCMRLSVGAVVVVDNRIVSIGYNGVPPGEPHCLGNDCPGRSGCQLAVHAEINALNYVPRSIKWAVKDLYVTNSPCCECTYAILHMHVDRVFFGHLYRLSDHLKDIPRLYQVTPSGFVVDYHTKNVLETAL
jgi:dCMP deaminase